MFDCILIGPQTKFLYDDSNHRYGDKISISVIDTGDYEMMDAEKVLQKVIIRMKKFHQ